MSICYVQVVIVEASTSGLEADAISAEASARVLQAFAAAWVVAGHQESELIHLVVRAAVRVPAQSRLPLLSALSTPHSSVSSLPKPMLIMQQCFLEYHVTCPGTHPRCLHSRWAAGLSCI